MIRIDDEYILNANESCYILEKIGKIEDINSQNYGKETKIIQGYYTTIENALNGYIKVKTRKYVSNKNENSFLELLKNLKELKSKVNKILEGV